MKEDGTFYPANSLYNMSCGLLQHFRDDLKRFDLNIFAKDEPKFQCFRNALDSRMKEMTASGIGVKELHNRCETRGIFCPTRFNAH